MTWRYARASIAGTSHIAADKAGDDACYCDVFRIGEVEYFLGVVSDGAGSADLSRFGSEVVVANLADNVRCWLNEGNSLGSLTRDVVLFWLDCIRDCITELAKKDFTDVSDYAATLVFALVGGGHSAFGQIGDGAVVISDLDDNWTTVFWPQHGEYANQTFFVTGDRAHGQLVVEVCAEEPSDVVLFTDGLERVLLDFKQRKAHVPVFVSMQGPLQRTTGEGEIGRLSNQLAEYLRSPGITSHSDDDLTLVIATRREVGKA